MKVEINKDNYQELVVESSVPMVVDFWGPKCARCLDLMPAMEAIADEKKDQMRLVKIDTTKNRRLCMGLRLMKLPAFIFYRDGKEAGRIFGDELTEHDLRQAVDKLLSGQAVS